MHSKKLTINFVGKTGDTVLLLLSTPTRCFYSENHVVKLVL